MKRVPILPWTAALLLAAPTAMAAAPTGSLDAAQWNLIGGWARDPDHTGPLAVHIYIDGNLAHAMLANGNRPDLPFADKVHGFTWVPPLLGPGTHQIVVYAVGVDGNGTPNSENPSLPGSPKPIAAGCTGFSLSANVWCQAIQNYYTARSADTRYLFSDQVRVGMSPSYGGTVFELYGADHSFNRLVEHGGAAVQLSVWGYDPKGPDAFFASDTCDPTPYPSEAACLAAGHGACRVFCCSQGDHVADCTNVKACAFGAGGPFNPIQAQAADCGWDSPTNDVDSVTVQPSGAVTIKKASPWHFTKSTNFPGMSWEQTTGLVEAGVRLDYRITYSGPYSLTPHPQEIPAIFPAAGLHHTYFYYTGSTPYSNASSPVKKVTAPASGLMLRLKNRAPYPHPNVDDVLTENWVSACDSSASTCVTVAVFSAQYKEISAAGYPGNGEGYLTPLGGFAIKPGMDEQFTTWLFPYRHDEVVKGKAVRQWIYDIAASQGCLALGGACNDQDPCTTDDRCLGDGTCAGTPGGCGQGGSGGAPGTGGSGGAPGTGGSSGAPGTGGSAGAPETGGSAGAPEMGGSAGEAGSDGGATGGAAGDASVAGAGGSVAEAGQGGTSSGGAAGQAQSDASIAGGSAGAGASPAQDASVADSGGSGGGGVWESSGDDSGCGCRVAPEGEGGWVGAALSLLGLLIRKRRRGAVDRRAPGV